MAGCRIVNDGVKKAFAEIENNSAKYEKAGEDFMTAFDAAISEMEGAAKDALKAFVVAKISPYVKTDLPKAIKGMAELLEANRSNFETVDQQLADSMNQ